MDEKYKTNWPEWVEYAEVIFGIILALAVLAIFLFYNGNILNEIL
jgi:cytochrome bd-type quinol oxidase subunit 1